jgi:hypothetical protein
LLALAQVVGASTAETEQVMADEEAREPAAIDPRKPLARLPGETPKAHNALLVYAELGSDRSLEKTRQALGKDSAGYVRTLETWSSQHRWQERVALHDALLAQERQRRITEDYLEDIQEHQERYRHTGRELFAVSRMLLSKIAQAAKDDEMPMNAATLHALVRGFQISAELEAHSLSLDRLLPMLDYADDDDEGTLCSRCNRRRRR